MRGAGQSIKDRIRYRRVINEGMPVFDWQLAANDGRAFTDTIIQKLQKIGGLLSNVQARIAVVARETASPRVIGDQLHVLEEGPQRLPKESTTTPPAWSLDKKRRTRALHTAHQLCVPIG